MKIAFMADLHIGHYSEFDIDGSRLQRCLDAYRQVHMIAKAAGCTCIIDAGDLLDQKNLIDFTTYNPVFELFDELHPVGSTELPLFSLVGNHNMARVNDPTVNNLVPLRKHITVIDAPFVATWDDVNVWFIPYRRSLKQWWHEYEKLSHDVDEYASNRVNILVSHQEIKGAQPGTHRYVASDGVDANKLPGPFDWCVFGHYHKCQFLQPNVFYLGATLQQAFDEEGNAQGFWIYDTAPPLGSSAWQWQPINSPLFFTINCTPPDNYNYYRVRGVKKDETVQNARFEPAPVVEVETRLNVKTAAPADLIEAYLSARVPPERHAAVRKVVSQL